MADPLNPQVEGDLGALGISDRNPISVEEPEPVEEAQATAAEEVVASEPQVEPEVQAEPEQAEGEESSLITLIEQEAAPVAETPDELQAAREEIARLKGAAEERERLAEAEKRVLALTEPKAPAQDEPTNYMSSPAVQAVLRQVRDESPEQYEQTLVDLAKAEMRQEIEAKERQFTERITQMEQQRQQEAQQAQVRQVIETTLTDISKEGGLYAELVDDWKTRRMDSFVGKKMMETPGMFYSEQGVRDAVMSLESKLRHQMATKKSGVGTQAGVVASAGTGVASTRGVSMQDKPKKVSPEDEYTDRIFNARRAAKIEFLG